MNQPAADPTAVLEPPPDAVELVQRVEATRREWRRFLGWRAAVRVALVVLIAGGGVALADLLWVLGTPARLGAWIVGVLGFVFFGTSRTALLRAAFGPQDAAAEIEHAFPDLGQRVCTTLDYARPTAATMPAWPALVAALTRDTSRRARGLSFQQVVPWNRLGWPVAALAGQVLICLITLALIAEARLALLRLFLLPVHYTQLAVEPGNHQAKVGTDVTVRAILSGRPVARLELLQRQADSNDAWSASSFLPDHEANKATRVSVTGTVETTITNCQEDLEYRVVAGPIESAVFRLTVLHPLVLNHFRAQVQPPAYTRQKPSVVEQSVGDAGEVRDFKVIQGSQVRLQFTLDRSPVTAELRWAPAGTDASSASATEILPLPMAAAEPILVGEFAAVARELRAELHAQAADGMELEPKRFRILVQLDRKPTIRFARPDEQLEVVPSTEVPIEVATTDDFGIAQVGIVYQIGNGPKKTLRLDKPAGQPLTLATLATLYLEEHQVTFKDSVSYHAFVEDNYPHGPHRVTTDLRYIDIRPYKRSYQVLKTGGT